MPQPYSMRKLIRPRSAEPILLGERVMLRLMENHDVKPLLDYYRRNRDFHQPTDPIRPPAYFTEAFWKKMVKVIRQEYEKDLSVRLLLFRRDDPGRVVGIVNFNQIVRGALQGCYLGYSLDEHEQNQGLMSEALRVAIDFMFRTKKLHRIMANYIPENERSAKVLAKLNFIIEGHAREYLLINGRWQDHVMTSLTNPDWRPL